MTVDPLLLLRTVHFAADKHRYQTRKDEDGSPYINHPIQVAELLARVGDVTDPATLQAAILHDVVEDTETTVDELREVFSPDVAAIVAEVSDDKSLEKAERKRLQEIDAPGLSRAAKLVKLGDKICNLDDVVTSPPQGWDLARRRAYLEWTERVVAGLRGTNAPLERLYDERLAAGRAALGSEGEPARGA